MKIKLFSTLALALLCAACVTSGTSLLNTAARSSQQPAAEPAMESGPRGTASPTTYRNPERQFQFTLPAGWEVVEDPTSESISVMKVGAPRNFNLTIEQMVPSFPRAASVKASLQQSKERVQINKLLEAKRRDDGNIKKGCGVIGWEITEAPTKSGFQRIIWQAYDGENYYYNFMAATTNEDFQAAQPELRQIIESVKFCE